MPDALVASLPTDPHVLRYLEHVRVEKRLAARTLTLYTLDLEKLAQVAAGVNLPLLPLTSAHAALWRRCTAAGAAGGGLR